jgi:hypothetical protein
MSLSNRSEPGGQTLADNRRISRQVFVESVTRGLYFHVAKTGHKPTGARDFEP